MPVIWLAPFMQVSVMFVTRSMLYVGVWNNRVDQGLIAIRPGGPTSPSLGLSGLEIAIDRGIVIHSSSEPHLILLQKLLLSLAHY